MIVIILRKPIEKETLRYITQKYREDQLQFFSFNLDPNLTNVKGFKVTPIEYDEQAKKEISDKAFDFIIESGHRKINGSKIIDQLSIEDSRFWYYTKFTLFYRYRAAQYSRYELESALEAVPSECKKIYLHGFPKNSIFHRNDNTEIDFIPTKENKKSNVPKIQFGLIFIIRTLIGFLLNLINSKKKKHLFLINPEIQVPLIKLNDLSKIKGDHYSQYLIDKINVEDDFYTLSEFYPPKFDSRIDTSSKLIFPLKWKGSLYFEPFLLLELFSVFSYKKILKEYKSKLKSTFKEQGEDLDSQILFQEIKKLGSLHTYLYLRERASKRMLKKWNTLSVSGTHEHTMRAKTHFDSAKRIDIKTFAIQHGVIHPAHMNYIYNEKDAAFEPFPDYMFVWGEYWNRVLNQISTYPERSVIPIGQIRSDIIPRLNEAKKSNTINFLWASQPLFAGEEGIRLEIAKCFMQLTKEFQEVNFTLKPHPAEKDWNYFHDIAKSVGATNYNITNDDLYQLLASSDTVFVYHSTVGAEAVYFKKTLLVYDYQSADNSGYISSKVGYPVRNYEELKAALLRIVNSEQIIEPKYQEEFINDRLHKIDGKVCDRIINKIRELA